MIGSIRRWLSPRYPYTNPIDHQRASGLLFVMSGMGVIWAIWTLATLLNLAPTLSLIVLVDTLSLVVFPVLLVVMFVLLQTGRLKAASWSFVFFLTLFSAFSITNGLYGATITFPTIAIIAAGLLLERQVLFLVFSVIILAAFTGAFAQSGLTQPLNTIPADTVTADLLGTLSFFSVISLFLFFFNSNSYRIVSQSLHSVEQLQQVGSFNARTNDTDELSLYQRAFSLIREELRQAYAQIYLVDESGKLTQRLRSGLASRQSDLQTSVTVGDASALYEALRTRQPVRVSNSDFELRRSHFLLTFGYSVEIPILQGEIVIGVLDIQSPNSPLSQAQITALSVLADQIATGIQKIRTEKALRGSLMEQETVLTNVRNQLREIRKIERQTLSTTWDNYLQQRGQNAIGFDIDAAGKAVAAHHLSPMVEATLKTGQLQITQVGESQVVNVPIMLRDDILGAMAFTLPPGQQIGERQVEMAQNVADRLALALENKRLFEQSQSQAIRERKANEASGLLISATDVETAIKLAAESFNKALGAVNTHIHLQPDAFAERAYSEETRPNPAIRLSSSEELL